MRKVFALLCALSITLFFSLNIFSVKADLIDELKIKIDERNKIIEDLEKEIAEYQAQVEKTSAKGKTLKNSIAALELTRKKLSTEISSIQNRISATNLSIEQLDVQISNTEATINEELDLISSILNRTEEEESSSFVEVILSYPSISVVLDKVESLSQLNQGLLRSLTLVRESKLKLENNKIELQGKKKQLVTLVDSLSDKKKVAEYNKAQTNKLLTQTKNEEATYKKLLQEKQALHDAFERELLDYESQLKFAIDPSSLPESNSGVLKWPLENVKVTQTFGKTDFSKTHSQVYNGQGHNGIDLRASVGTKVMSALSGKVVGTGNTDTACPGASYGKWVLVEHSNGLSTLYAHLSVIKVVSGQNVNTGDILGYSGDTGYSTGPHLHFTVYATQGVKILSRQSKVCNAKYTMPVASLNAYLNPLMYL